MSYEVGTCIDLRQLNSGIIAVVDKSNFEEAVSRPVEVGSRFRLKRGPQGFIVMRRIPVIFA